MIIFLSLVIFVISLCYYFVKKRYQFWNDNGFMSAKPSFPFGNLTGVGTKISAAEAMQTYYKKYKGKGPAVGLYFFLTPTLLPLDPELLKNLFVKDFASFHDRGFYYNKKDDPLSANMLTLEGQEWRDVRTKLSPIFTSGKMKMMFNIVNEIGDKFVVALQKDMKAKSNEEMREWLSRFTSDVIGNIAFGIDCNCLENPDSMFRKHGKRLFDITALELLKFLFTSSLPELSRKLKLLSNPKEPTEFFKKTFLQTIQSREQENITRNDFVQLLLQMKKDTSEGKQFTDLELAAESFLFYAGGFETSSTLMTFCVYELAINTDIQERLRNEIRDHVESKDQLTYKVLFEMKYLDMVINETLRKYPPIPTNTRKCTKDYEIPGTNFVLPKGLLIEIPTYAFHHDPEYFPNPDKFDPERFSEENEKSRVPYTFIPFGEGPRNCIGSRFAYMQSKLGIVKLLQNFKISVCDKTPIPMKFEPAFPFLAPVGGMWLEVEPIKNSD